jgi:hypothetical protein
MRFVQTSIAAAVLLAVLVSSVWLALNGRTSDGRRINVVVAFVPTLFVVVPLVAVMWLVWTRPVWTEPSPLIPLERRLRRSVWSAAVRGDIAPEYRGLVADHVTHVRRFVNTRVIWLFAGFAVMQLLIAVFSDGTGRWLSAVVAATALANVIQRIWLMTRLRRVEAALATPGRPAP